MEKGTSSSPSDEACPGCVGYYTLKGQICKDCEGTDWKARLKGKKGEGKHYYFYSEDWKGNRKGKKGKGKGYDSDDQLACPRCGAWPRPGSPGGKCWGCKGSWSPRAICRHPKCLMCYDARRVRGKGDSTAPCSCTSCGHSFEGPWDRTICRLCALRDSSPEHFELIKGEGKKGKMDKGEAKKALQSASTLSEVYPFNAMGTSRDCDTAVCASCGKSWAKNLTRVDANDPATWRHFCHWCAEELHTNCPDCRGKGWQLYCPKCLLGGDRHGTSQGYVVVNVSIEDMAETDEVQVICTNLAGKEVLHKTMQKDTPLGTLRVAVEVALPDLAEKRMARDGGFYTQEEFLTEDPSSGQLNWAVAPAQLGSKLLADGELLMDDSKRLSDLSKEA